MCFNDSHECYRLVRCVCDTATNSLNECSARETISKLSASEALNLTLQHPPNSCFALRMVDVDEPDSPASRRSSRDFLSLIMALMKKCRAVKSTSWSEVTWSIPVEGVCKLLDPMHKLLEPDAAPGQGLTRGELRELRSIIILAIDLIWIDRDLIQADNLNADIIRMDVAYFFSQLLCYPQLHHYFKIDKIIDLVWLCWFETPRIPHPTIHPHRNTAIEVLEMMFEDHDEERILKLGERLLATFSLDYIAGKAADWLGDENVLNRDLELEFRGIGLVFQCFTCMGIPYDTQTAPFLESSVHLHACNALCRQIIAGEQNDPSTIEIMIFTPYIFLFVMKSRKYPIHQSLSDLFHSTPFPTVLSRIFLSLHSNSIEATREDLTRAFDGWDKFLIWVTHGALCKDEKCWMVGSAESLDSSRQGFELVYAETLSRLRLEEDQGPLGAQVCDLWEVICAILGLRCHAMRERFKLLKKCCACNCPQRLVGISSPKRYCCAKCETVFYCDRTCQKLDWAAHKPVCDPTQFATYDRLVTLYEPPSSKLSPSSHLYGGGDD
ncbi:hypothetical protein CPB83DRAFT_858931 [Crepidotus variabilis]|uniref:MYND-type domain-containing protein n=1 Tax=Crepidotus variabilis TaxID=179855 RepID=A0A9P6EAK4_9AGAR|nr:hypothetical protein CPB83DRAFT_858931 [Crepidotus variabilis]